MRPFNRYPAVNHQTEREFELVLVTKNELPEGSAQRERMGFILHEASCSGALREGFPPGTEALEKAWNDLVAECLKIRSYADVDEYKRRTLAANMRRFARAETRRH